MALNIIVHVTNESFHVGWKTSWSYLEKYTGSDKNIIIL